jgi:hypothetical protein
LHAVVIPKHRLLHYYQHEYHELSTCLERPQCDKGKEGKLCIAN